MAESGTAKRSLLANYPHCWRTWRNLRRYPGLFSFADALQNWKAVLLPLRFSHRTAGEKLAREAKIESVGEGAAKVTVLERDLVFYWLGNVDTTLHYIIDQEFNPNYPHNYTTPPVHLTSQSTILDVGACEGLFAFRVLRANQAARVICFEPSAANVNYLRRAAEDNGLAERISVEAVAVGRASGQIRLQESVGSPDGSFVDTQTNSGAGKLVDCVCLDEYCASKNLKLSHRDLIKIDAEGSDLDVLLGAERLIRNRAPQIAVTTYHKAEHAAQIVDFLKSVQPAYRLRLKGFSSWTPKPNPVLLQAATLVREQTDAS